MKSDRQAPVAIIGGGASGTILAAQLARRGIGSLLVEGGDRAGMGIAYSTNDPAHLLNVRAEGMSAWADDPGHFARHFAEEDGEPRGFAERRLYGRYLRNLLAEAVASGHATVVNASAISASRSVRSWHIGLDGGESLDAAALVLCTGNQQPEGISAFDGTGRFIANPWAGEAQRAVQQLAETGGDALLIGTGLTMVDLVLSLDSAGHAGRIVALSRRGLIPRSHADFAPAPVEPDHVPHGSSGQLLRWLRRRGADVGWRAAVDSLRPHSHRLWQSFGLDEKRRFLRHARPWWDVHRHRIAPQVGATLARMIAEDRLQIIAGRVLSASASPPGIEVAFRRRRNQTVERMSFAYAFNCTGPLQRIERTGDPLLRSLLDSGAARADELGMGFEIDEDCSAGEGLWALGPLTKGRYWEIIAVPDIREQAAALAGHIARELENGF